jgi:hypothetical protein
VACSENKESKKEGTQNTRKKKYAEYAEKPICAFSAYSALFAFFRVFCVPSFIRTSRLKIPKANQHLTFCQIYVRMSGRQLRTALFLLWLRPTASRQACRRNGGWRVFRHS